MTRAWMAVAALLIMAALPGRSAGQATPPARGAAAPAQAAIDSALIDSAVVLSLEGFLAFETGTIEGAQEALQHWRDAVVAFRRAGHPRGVAVTLPDVARAYMALDATDSAASAFAEALAVARGAGYHDVTADVLHWLGAFASQAGAVDTAAGLLDSVLSLRRAQRGYPADSLAALLIDAASVQNRRQDGASALRHAGEAMRLLGARGPSHALAAAMTQAGFAHQSRSELESALALHHEAARTVRSLADSASLWVALLNAGNVHALQHRLDSTVAHAREAWSIVHALGDSLAIEQAFAELVRLDSAQHALGEGVDAHSAARFTSLYELNLMLDRRELAFEDAMRVTAAYLTLGRSDSAMAYARRAHALAVALDDPPRIIAAHQAIGGSHQIAGRADSARHYFALAARTAAGRADPSQAAFAMITVATAYAMAEQYDSALTTYARALRDVRTRGDAVNEMRVLRLIGQLYAGIGRLDSAETALRGASEIARREGWRTEEAAALDQIASLEVARGRTDAALGVLRRVLVVHQESGDRVEELDVLRTIAAVHHDAGRSDSALAIFHRALAIGREISNSRFGPFAPLILSRIGTLYLERGAADSAVTYFRLGLLALDDVGTPAGRSSLVMHLAQAYTMLGQRDSAVALAHRALQLARSGGYRFEEIAALHRLGVAYMEPGSPASLRRSVAYFDSSAAIRASVLRRAGGDANRVSLSEDEARTDMWALAWLFRSDEVGHQSASLAGLAATERGRAQALRELMGLEDANVRAGADLVAEGRRLVQSLVRDGASALVYALASDRVLIWFVDATGQVRWFDQEIGSDSVDALVAAVRGGFGAGAVEQRMAAGASGALERGVGVRRAGTSDAAAAAARLADLLVPDGVLNLLPPGGDLVIVPQGSLALLPFGALPVRDGELLGGRMALRFAPSLAMLADRASVPGRGDVPASAARRSAIVVGDPTMPRAFTEAGEPMRLAGLAGAATEGADVAARLGARLLTADAASEAHVRERLASAPLVHLATHGFAYASDARSRESFVALAAGGGHDGLLTVGELLDDPALQLRAELVVLSACQTGLGDLKQSEGTMGLQRAFLARGARSVLVSLWNVSDEATALLMRRFYEHWLDDADGPSKAEALRRAQADVRATAEFEAPKYWAAFQLVGAR